ncbi:MAG: hypothetical protein LBR70_03165 [Lactobacillaceae bacterium]|nr:hypothetical protein [Lactobacillaceae bacterium]
MNKYILVFSIVSLLSVNVAQAEDAVELVSADDDAFLQTSQAPEADGDFDYGDIDIDDYAFDQDGAYDEEITTGGDIYTNSEDVQINTTTGPVLKAPANTFPLSRSGMMVSPTPVSNNNAQGYGLSSSGAAAKTGQDVSLTDVFESQAEENTQPAARPETWLDRLRSSAETEMKSGGGSSNAAIESAEDKTGLKSLVEESKASGNKRSNAAVFDVAGAMLRMSPKQIDDVLTRRGYRKTNEVFEIPNFIKWRKEEECRASGVIGYERLANCVIQSSKAENYQYLEKAAYNKFDTQETINIAFTSNFTSNKAYKILYTSLSANVTGNSQKSIYMRNIKVYDFWKRINQKYGQPDNKEDVIWSLGGNKPYMQAKTGRLLLEDPMLRELDYTRMSREDQKFINTNVYNF